MQELIERDGAITVLSGLAGWFEAAKEDGVPFAASDIQYLTIEAERLMAAIKSLAPNAEVDTADETGCMYNHDHEAEPEKCEWHD